MNLWVLVIETGVKAAKDHRGRRDSNEWLGQDRVLYLILFVLMCRVICADYLEVAEKQIRGFRRNGEPRVKIGGHVLS